MKFLPIVYTVIFMLLSGCRQEPPYEEMLVSRIAQTKLSVVHMLSTDTSCTAFHVGHELFITASHCFSPDTEYGISDSDGETYSVRPILIDRDLDVAVFEGSGFDGPALTLWNERLYGEPKVGSTIVSMGFPGYYLQGFVFEEGSILDHRKLNGARMIISRGVSYPGESGGPVISLRTGQVVGLVHALAERITELDNDTQVHNTLSLLVAWSEIKKVLEQARKVR